jgi:hypothetical protein
MLRNLPTVHCRSLAKVENGQGLQKTIPSFSPDVVVMDVMMPGFGGFDVCRSIKTHPATAYLPVRLARYGGVEFTVVMPVPAMRSSKPWTMCSQAKHQGRDCTVCFHAEQAKGGYQNDQRHNSSLADRGRSG